MDHDVVIFTACSEAYFPACVDLIQSIRAACGTLPRMRVLDVGLTPAQAAELSTTVEAVIAPGWDVGDPAVLPQWFRAMTARPCLPNYAGDAAIIAWIDCDAWVQRWTPVAALIDAARDGRMAITEETYGPGFTAELPAEPGKARRYVVTAESAKANLKSCYRLCFGAETAAALGDLPTYNSGVFALRADSPAWAVWRDVLAGALPNAFHKLVEQQALTVAIRQGRIAAAPQPREANYICGMELPWYSPQQAAFTIPGDQDRTIGVVHLTDTKEFPLLRIPQWPDGAPTAMPLVWRDLQRYRAGGLDALALAPEWMQLSRRWAGEATPIARNPARPETWGKVGRNEPCPCGSGQRYKQCHGRLV